MLWVLWTIRLALLLALAALALRAAGAKNLQAQVLAVRLWLAAALVYLAHVACAFHFVHDWSHAQAWKATARQTAEQLGWTFGGGLYFNYFFTVIWPVQAAWQWLAPRRYGQLPPAWRGAWLAFWLFMVLNGAVVFATGPTRWISVLALCGLACLAVCRRVPRHVVF